MEILSKLRSSIILGIGLCLIGSGHGSRLLPQQTSQEQAPAYPYTLNDDEFTVASAMYNAVHAEQNIFNGCGNVLAFKGKLQGGADQWILLQSKFLTNASSKFINILKGKTVKFLMGSDVISLVGRLDSNTKAYLDKLIQGNDENDKNKIMDQKEKELLQNIISALRLYADSCTDFSKPSEDNCSSLGNGGGYGITNGYFYDYEEDSEDWSDKRTFIWFLSQMHIEIEESKSDIWRHEGEVKETLRSMLAWLASSSEQKTSLQQAVKSNVLEKINEVGAYLGCVVDSIFWFKYALHTEIQLAVLQSKGIITLLDNYHIISLKQLCISCEHGAPLRKWPLFIFVTEDESSHILSLDEHYSSKEFKNEDDLDKSVTLYTYNI